MEDETGFYVGDDTGQWPVTWNRDYTALCCMCQQWLETGYCKHVELIQKCLKEGEKIEVPEGKKMRLNGGNVIRERMGDRFEVVNV